VGPQSQYKIRSRVGLVDVFAATIPTLKFTSGIHVNYAGTVLPMRDGLPKLTFRLNSAAPVWL